MLLLFKREATEEQIERAADFARKKGLTAQKIVAPGIRMISLDGRTELCDMRDFLLLEGVQKVIRTEEPYKLVSLKAKKNRTIIDFGGFKLGGDEIVLLAGPCAVESRDQILGIASSIKKLGVKILRGGAFKPRTSPYAFQGLGEKGLKFLREAADTYDMKIVSEVIDTTYLSQAEEYCDILQVGARNMQNYGLLKELGRSKKPVLLKRGMSATISDLLFSAEYLLSGGNNDVILCERGIRTFEDSTRNTMDISAIPVLKNLTHLPVIADPSHGTGFRELVAPMARAAISAGADGIMLEVHTDPASALSDGAQSLYIGQLEELIGQLKVISSAINRTLAI